MVALTLLSVLGPRAAEIEIGAELLAALAYWAGSGRTGKPIRALLEPLRLGRLSIVGGC